MWKCACVCSCLSSYACRSSCFCADKHVIIWVRACENIWLHICEQMCAYVYARVYVSECESVFICHACVRGFIDVCVCIRISSCTYAYAYAFVRVHVFSYTCVCVWVCIRMCVNACSCMSGCIRTYMSVCIHPKCLRVCLCVGVHIGAYECVLVHVVLHEKAWSDFIFVSKKCKNSKMRSNSVCSFLMMSLGKTWIGLILIISDDFQKLDKFKYS